MGIYINEWKQVDFKDAQGFMANVTFFCLGLTVASFGFILFLIN